uniref:Putative secreted protein n=1 Tax=Ixodes ricinus TaxID=34613 RepID=A0A6B0U5Z3_IXORI
MLKESKCRLWVLTIVVCGVFEPLSFSKYSQESLYIFLLLYICKSAKRHSNYYLLFVDPIFVKIPKHAFVNNCDLNCGFF